MYILYVLRTTFSVSEFQNFTSQTKTKTRARGNIFSDFNLGAKQAGYSTRLLSGKKWETSMVLLMIDDRGYSNYNKTYDIWLFIFIYYTVNYKSFSSCNTISTRIWSTSIASRHSFSAMFSAVLMRRWSCSASPITSPESKRGSGAALEGRVPS